MCSYAMQCADHLGPKINDEEDKVQPTILILKWCYDAVNVCIHWPLIFIALTLSVAKLSSAYYSHTNRLVMVIPDLPRDQRSHAYIHALLPMQATSMMGRRLCKAFSWLEQFTKLQLLLNWSTQVTPITQPLLKIWSVRMGSMVLHLYWTLFAGWMPIRSVTINCMGILRESLSSIQSSDDWCLNRWLG